MTPRQLIGLGGGQRAVDFGNDLVPDRAHIDRGLRVVVTRSALAIGLRRAGAVATAAGRHDRTIEAFAVGAAKRILAGRIEVG